MEETILMRRSKAVARIRWTSPKKLCKEEPVTQDSEGDTLDESNTIMDVWYENNIDLTNITGEHSIVEDDVMNEAESGSKVDSTKKWIKGKNMTREAEGDQSQGEVRGSTTPYIFLTLEELEALRATIKKTLKDLGEGKD